jgi:uncharacterized protein YcnI
VRVLRVIAPTATALLALAAPAGAHVITVPTSVTAGQRETVTLLVTNDHRQDAMTSVSVTVPAGLAIIRTVPPGGGWQGAVDGSTATWTGGSLPPGEVTSFSLVLDAGNEPGDVTMEIVHLYADGGQVPMPVVLTILPGRASSGSLGIALVVVAIGLLLIVTLGAVVWLRRSRPLQER